MNQCHAVIITMFTWHFLESQIVSIEENFRSIHIWKYLEVTTLYQSYFFFFSCIRCWWQSFNRISQIFAMSCSYKGYKISLDVKLRQKQHSHTYWKKIVQCHLYLICIIVYNTSTAFHIACYAFVLVGCCNKMQRRHHQIRSNYIAILFNLCCFCIPPSIHSHEMESISMNFGNHSLCNSFRMIHIHGGHCWKKMCVWIEFDWIEMGNISVSFCNLPLKFGINFNTETDLFLK